MAPYEIIYGYTLHSHGYYGNDVTWADVYFTVLFEPLWTYGAKRDYIMALQ